ncbi:hypothetical protein [Shewanella sp. FJAT-52076]|uniref:hypothetical protein n=1 Tax=Shewanella sp. FJAT-52076 TaxID=2864202 RepID=UPI001C6598EB|nr:hypothetical protein [Shewanella sp. FJAT-52076]QYJ74136.1 hypothetical protein K0H79_12210 [Shewanella sp. FJAT-52076]
MKTLEISLLHYGKLSHLGLAYLAYFKHRGLRFKRIILIRDTLSPSPVFPLSPDTPEAEAADLIDDFIESRRLDAGFAALCRQVSDYMGVDVNPALCPPLEEYAESVTDILVKGINDPRLVELLQQESCRTFLYAGGGRIGPEFFAIEGAKYIHVHAGGAPAFRGADTLLWETLYGAPHQLTCFFQTPGLDDGDIIAKFPVMIDRIPLDWPKWDPELLYKVWLFCYDPHLRARFITDLIVEQGIDMSCPPVKANDDQQSRVFYLMAPQIRALALERIFSTDNCPGHRD